MSPSVSLALWVILALVILFATVIYFSLRVRKRAFAKNLEMRAQDFFPSVQSSAVDFANLLYGVWQDKSATQVELLVRDSRDQEIGSVVFNAVSRQPCFTIQLNGAVYEADARATFRESMVLYPAGKPSDALCTLRELVPGSFQFEVRGVGTIESKRAKGLIAPVYEFGLDGIAVGKSQHIGGWRNRGIYVVLPETVPLPVRVFMLAVQRQRT